MARNMAMTALLLSERSKVLVFPPPNFYMERLFQARRLVHAVEVNPNQRLEVNETVWRSTGGNVGVPVEVFKGYLEPYQLRKLKYKAIFSIRDDLIKEDRKRIAQIILNERA